MEAKPQREKKLRPRAPDGNLLLAWRAPTWSFPSLPDDLQLSPTDSLEACRGRNVCHVCGRSRQLFCYDCLEVLTERASVPHLQLPASLHIILHRDERRSACTGVHAALLAPASVALYKQGAPLPTFDPASTVLLFPSPQSVPIDEVDTEAVKSVVVVESKWKGSQAILNDPALSRLPHVRLRSTQTAFWRYTTRGITSDAVSTIEAIHATCRHLHAHGHGGDPSSCHCYDDLLWYFAYFHRLIERQG
eukprot:jgi/Mesen1/9540/ME000064S08884